VGRLADGRRYIATIEPWHGFQVVVYTPPKSAAGLWDRQVVDEPVQWGHAVWCADLDGDGDQELLIGQRDKSKDPRAQPERTRRPRLRPEARFGTPGVHPAMSSTTAASAPRTSSRPTLDGDGRSDIVAGGRSTHNVRIYWKPPEVRTNFVGWVSAAPPTEILVGGAALTHPTKD